MNKTQYDLVATIGEYTDREGNTKKRYQKCGVAFTNDEGQTSIKLDAIPVTPEWNGWISLFEKQEYNNTPRPSSEPARRQPATASASSSDQDDIPF